MTDRRNMTHLKPDWRDEAREIRIGAACIQYKIRTGCEISHEEMRRAMGYAADTEQKAR